jgi:hypothetical protein
VSDYAVHQLSACSVVVVRSETTEELLDAEGEPAPHKVCIATDDSEASLDM